MFQFHTGSIKAKAVYPAGCFAWRFQFHTGSIKAKGEGKQQIPHTRFNSTLVRLKLDGVAVLGDIGLFQFHTGSIKAENAECVRRCIAAEFQFHTGSIKAIMKKLFAMSNVEFQFHTGSIKA